MNKATIPAVALATLALAGCSSVSTESDLTAVQYAGGEFQSKAFKDCVAPSTKKWGGISDAFYPYPASQRNFVFDSGAAKKDSDSFTFTTADGIEMTVVGIANFKLNTECQALRTFHESIGNRYKAYFTDGNNAPEGWGNVLTDYIGRPLDTAIDRAGQKYNSEDLYNNTATKTSWEKDVIGLLPELVNRQTDGDTEFFQNWAITLQKPELPPEIKAARVEKEAGLTRADAEKAKADAQVAVAESQKQLAEAEVATEKVWIDALGVQGWLQKQALEAGVNPFQPGGTPLVNTP